MPDRRFIHLHLHSQYSLLDGAIKFDELLERCKELGMDSVAVTNTLLHSLLSSLGLAVICITAVNGTVGLLAFTNFKNICIWFLTCVIATVAIRAVLWIRESR